MNTYVLYSTLVFLAIAGGVKCKISSYGADINDLQNESEMYAYSEQSAYGSVDFHPLSDDSSEETLEDKCRKNSLREDAFEMAQNGMRDFSMCLNTRNVTDIINKFHGPAYEINDSLFKSLCKKVPDFHYCEQKYHPPIRECLSAQENYLITSLEPAKIEIESYLCDNDAQRISKIFLDGDMNCIWERGYGINQCLNTLTNSFSKKSGPVSFDSFLTNFKYTQEQCIDFRKLQFCVVKELLHCKGTTADTVFELFQIIYRNTPCSKSIKRINV